MLVEMKALLLASIALAISGTTSLAADPNNPYPKGTVEHACHEGNVAACTRWRDRECHAGNRAACDYYVARKQKDPIEWCSQQYPDDAGSYRFCLNGSPDR
jgi:hypothetical protein